MRGLAEPALRHELAGGERQQFAVARGDGAAEEADPQREPVGDRPGAEDARPLTCRQTISESGSTMIAPSASVAIRFSMRMAAAFISLRDA